MGVSKGMPRTKVEYGDYNLSTITGCKHGCQWDCWARKLAKRRGEDFEKATWHPERLHQAENTKHLGDYTEMGFPRRSLNRFKSVNPNLWYSQDMTLVNFQGDMWGDWVPDEYIEQTICACRRAPWHVFVFLTKNPGRYANFGSLLEDCPNFWLGTSVEGGASIERLKKLMTVKRVVGGQWKPWVSFEPLLEEPLLYRDILDSLNMIAKLDWVVIGALTGKGAKQPKKEWVQALINTCNMGHVPYFLKNNLEGYERHQAFPTIKGDGDSVGEQEQVNE